MITWGLIVMLAGIVAVTVSVTTERVRSTAPLWGLLIGSWAVTLGLVAVVWGLLAG